MTELPTGTVTFLFTDIEGSTRLLQRHGDEFPHLLETHSRLIRSAVGETDGVEIRTEGDSFFVAFGSAIDAVRAAVLSQQSLAAYAWPVGGKLRVRMGLHSGLGRFGGDNYVGLDVHRAARISAVWPSPHLGGYQGSGRARPARWRLPTRLGAAPSERH